MNMYYENFKTFSVFSILPINVPYLKKKVTVSKSSLFLNQRRQAKFSRYICNKEDLPPLSQTGIVCEWPQKKMPWFPKEKFCTAMRLIAHFLFWLHVIHILPSGSAINFPQPPWKYEYRPPLPKSGNQVYVIEPDWNSLE